MTALLSNSKASSKRRNMDDPFNLSISEMYATLIRQGGLCYYSGVPMSPAKGNYRISIERVNVKLNYSFDNVVFCCQEFNSIDLTRVASDDAEGCGGWSKEKYQQVFNHHHAK